MPDPYNDSPIIPSVVSFMEQTQRRKPKKHDNPNLTLDPDPSRVLVGAAAKSRINSHPHHSLYHAKRFLGRQFSDDAVSELITEVEFIVQSHVEIDGEHEEESIIFNVPVAKDMDILSTSSVMIKPEQVGSYIG